MLPQRITNPIPKTVKQRLTVWPWAFFGWKTANDCFYLLKGYAFINIVYLILILVWEVISFKKMVHFFQNFQFCEVQVFEVWPNDSLDFLGGCCYVPIFISCLVKFVILSLIFGYFG